MNSLKTQEANSHNIKYRTIMDSVEWMEQEEEYHKYCMDKGYSGNAYVYCMSPHIRYKKFETTYKKTKKGVSAQKIQLDILPLDKIMAERNWTWINNHYPKNYPQTFCKIGISENIVRRIIDHKKKWKRGFHLNGMIKFPDIIAAASFESFCFDYYKEYKNNDHKHFFQSTEVFFLPNESVTLNDALQEYMKSQKNLHVESLYFWC